jgi:hypothetical protein
MYRKRKVEEETRLTIITEVSGEYVASTMSHPSESVVGLRCTERTGRTHSNVTESLYRNTSFTSPSKNTIDKSVQSLDVAEAMRELHTER